MAMSTHDSSFSGLHPVGLIKDHNVKRVAHKLLTPDTLQESSAALGDPN